MCSCVDVLMFVVPQDETVPYEHHFYQICCGLREHLNTSTQYCRFTAHQHEHINTFARQHNLIYL